MEIKQLPQNSNAIGIDVGIKSFCAMSNEETIENPKYLQKSYEKLIKAQRRLSENGYVLNAIANMIEIAMQVKIF